MAAEFVLRLMGSPDDASMDVVPARADYDADEVTAAVEAWAAGHDAEEWEVVEAYGTGGFMPDRFTSLVDLCDIAEAFDMTADAAALAAWAEYCGDSKDAAGTFEEAYQGRFDNETAFAEELFEGIGWGEAMEAAGVPDYYFDMEAWARDLFMSDYFMDGGYVFRTDV